MTRIFRGAIKKLPGHILCRFMPERPSTIYTRARTRETVATRVVPLAIGARRTDARRPPSHTDLSLSRTGCCYEIPFWTVTANFTL